MDDIGELLLVSASYRQDKAVVSPSEKRLVNQILRLVLAQVAIELLLDLFSSVYKLRVHVVTHLPVRSQDSFNPVDQDPEIGNWIQHATKLEPAIPFQGLP